MITDMQRQSIHMMRLNGLSYSAIAKSVSLSPNTIKSICHRENIKADEVNDGGCKNCDKPLSHQQGRKKKRFCTDKCRTEWWNHNRQWARHKKCHILLCHYCGAEFNSFGNKKRKYCGRECYIRSRYGEGLP